LTDTILVNKVDCSADELAQLESRIRTLNLRM